MIEWILTIYNALLGPEIVKNNEPLFSRVGLLRANVTLLSLDTNVRVSTALAIVTRATVYG